MVFKEIALCLLCINLIQCQTQLGPDPWNYEQSIIPDKMKNDDSVPPDLRILSSKKIQDNKQYGTSEWFFRRILTILLNGGQIKKSEDGSVDVSLQMRFDEHRWKILHEYIISLTALTEDNFRRSLGYVEEAILKPTITEKITMAWNENIQIFIIEYKFYFILALSVISAIMGSIYLWSRVSYKHLLIIFLILLYLYEVFTSYKEAEHQELERFLSSLDKCKWQIWSSTCDVPPPNPIIFMKYMNPLKIGIRMFTTLISEPMIILSDTVKIMIHGITDGLWFPFDKVVYGILILSFNTLLIILLIMITFNFILNVPFNLNFFGFLNIGLRQRNRNVIPNINNNQIQTENSDRISTATLNRILDIVSIRNHSNNTIDNTRRRRKAIRSAATHRIQRSASTGRLTSLLSLTGVSHHSTKENKRRNNVGSGDQ